MTKYYETRGFKALQKHWYKKLEADGFQDIEHGDNKGLSGKDRRSVALFAAKYDLDIVGKVETDDALDAMNDLVNYSSGPKGAYYRMATDVAAQAFRAGLEHKRAFAFALFAQGHGRYETRTILEELGYPIRTDHQAKQMLVDFDTLVRKLCIAEQI